MPDVAAIASTSFRPSTVSICAIVKVRAAALAMVSGGGAMR
jgi:hypothetical protein